MGTLIQETGRSDSGLDAVRGFKKRNAASCTSMWRLYPRASSRRMEVGSKASVRKNKAKMYL